MQIASHAGNVCGWTGNSPCTEDDVTIVQTSRRGLTISFTLDVPAFPTPSTVSSSEANSTDSSSEEAVDVGLSTIALLVEYFQTPEFIQDISSDGNGIDGNGNGTNGSGTSSSSFNPTSSVVASSSVTFVSVEPVLTTTNTFNAVLGEGSLCKYVTQNLTASVSQSGSFCVGAVCTILSSGQGFTSNGLWCAGCSIESAGFSSDLEAQIYAYPWSSDTVSAGTLYGGLVASSVSEDFSLPNGGFVCPVDGSTCFSLEAEIGLVPVTGTVFAAFSSDASSPYNGAQSSIFCPTGTTHYVSSPIILCVPLSLADALSTPFSSSFLSSALSLVSAFRRCCEFCCCCVFCRCCALTQRTQQSLRSDENFRKHSMAL